MEKTIELAYGYTDKENKTHKSVTFGKRLKVADLIVLDMNPQAQNSTQYAQLIRRQMITKFGELPMPVILPVLVALDTADDDLLNSAADQFLNDSRNGRQSELLPDHKVRLMFGIKIDDVVYDTVKFGNRLTVADNVEADNRKLGNGVARICFQLGRQICELEDSESKLKLTGQLDLDDFANVDSEDFNALRLAAEFFRIPPQPSRRGKVHGVSDSEGNELDTRTDIESAD